jgi:hypothetical protein
MQRLIIFLGHPAYALSVVLFSLLLAGGVGSWLTQRFVTSRPARLSYAMVAAALATLTIAGGVTPAIAAAFAGSATVARIAIAAALLAIPGVFMGMCFPIGMSAAGRRAGVLTPWLWGINGAASVCASVLAVVVALSAGISASFWSGVACYAAALIALVRSGRRAEASSPVGAERLEPAVAE